MKHIDIKEHSWNALGEAKKPEENHIADVSEMIEENHIVEGNKKVEEIITGCPTGWKCGAECTNRCIL